MKIRRVAALAAAIVFAAGTVLSQGVYGNGRYVSAADEEEKSKADYTIRAYGYDQIYENGKYNTWNVAYKIKAADRTPLNFIVSSDLNKYEKEDTGFSYYPGDDSAYKDHLYALSKESVFAEGAQSITVGDGIYEIYMDAFIYSDDLEYLTIGDSVVRLESQNLPEDIIIRGHAGTYAENFANKNGYAFEHTGDLNNDSMINAADVLKMTSYMSGQTDFENPVYWNADENMDGVVNIADFILMKNEVLEPRSSGLGASAAGAEAVPDMKGLKRNTEKPEADGYMDFAAKSASPVLLDTEDTKGAENVVYSPLSVYMALSMAAECADGNTRDEFLTALSADDIEDLQAENAALFESLYFDNFTTYCKIANSLWLNDKWTFNKNTLETIADKYYAVSFSKNFADPAVPEEISSWIYKNTDGKIRPVIKIEDPDKDLLKIINTVSFKETWSSEFGAPSKGEFYLKDGSTLNCDYLKRYINISTENIGYGDGFMKYSERMNDRYRMNFVLPDEDVSINDIVSDSDAMSSVYNDDIEYRTSGINFKVPVFNISSKFNLIEASKSLGINEAFDQYLGGDFTKVVNYEENDLQGVYISEITHEATVKIDKDGCEAAAYTLISMNTITSAYAPAEIVDFELNRPFFWYISDSNGTPLFSGIINNPAEK